MNIEDGTVIVDESGPTENRHNLALSSHRAKEDKNMTNSTTAAIAIYYVGTTLNQEL